MKIFKIIIVLMIAVMTVTSLLAQDTGTGADRAKRDLKLGNTYREAGNFVKAAEYLEKGRMFFEKKNTWPYKYWRAVAYEFLGYLHRDMAYSEKSAQRLSMAISYFTKALSIYEEIISMDDGSQFAMSEVVKNIGNVNANLNKLQVVDINTVSAGEKIEENLIFNFDNGKHKTLPAGIPDDAVNISLANNKFKDFPGGLLRFDGLQYLDLSHNRIKTLPVNINDLQKLKYLNLEDNRLKSVPANLCLMKNLKVLNLRNNKIAFPDIINLIRCLPNTNILFDEYERKEDYEFEELEF